MSLPPTTLHDVLAARAVLRRYLPPTPLLGYPALDAELGFAALIKHENCQPTGAFKVRGGLYLLSRLSAEERRRGVTAASTGNHGLSVAYAAHEFGVRAIIGVPVGANPGKCEAMRALGAEVVEHGNDFDEARDYVESLAREQGYRYIHSGNEPDLLAGVGTLTLEMLEQRPEIDTLIVPVGGGSGASAAAIVAKAIDPAIRVVGVQAEGAPAAWQSWKEGKLLSTTRANTFAEGLATRTAFSYPHEVMQRLLDDFVLVDDEALRAAIRLYIEKAHTLAEAAGAASLAAACRLRATLQGHVVGLVLSGANLTLAQLRETLG